jgi:methylenetetrahydrofolate reductase (NADPH)
VIVSLEAVPRSREALIEYARTAASFRRISLINAPDLLRLPIRSWEACGILREAALEEPRPVLMPHLRAIDFSLDGPFPYMEYFRRLGIGHVLVIAGDSPVREGRRVYDTATVPFIIKLKREMPDLKIFAAFDPYRTNIRYELDYVKVKEEAGAEGFFSQPFFDLRLLEIYAEYLEGKQVFWGVSPVLSASSRNYWESRNRAVFPKSFRADLSWNIDFGRRVLHFCENNRFNLYLMPIRIDLASYLGGLFGGPDPGAL